MWLIGKGVREEEEEATELNRNPHLAIVEEWYCLNPRDGPEVLPWHLHVLCQPCVYLVMESM